MNRSDIRIAIVEDNGMARINLRNNLREMGFSLISCFSNGMPLRKAIGDRSFHLILIDYHLGQNKNGVEVIQELQKNGTLTASTSVIFITSDRLPTIIGQIVDVHPDGLILKPYTIRSLKKLVHGTLILHESLSPFFTLLDKANYEKALTVVDSYLSSPRFVKSRTYLLKLKSRVLLKLKRYDEAKLLFEGVLKSSDRVVWAKWGIIQSLQANGQTEESEELLEEMMKQHITKDKACEWLTQICMAKKEFDRAEDYIDNIKESQLSLAAARLKAFLYQQQNRMDDAIKLLERRREANKNIRERYAELSLELARCYLTIAEGNPPNERADTLKVAKFLISTAGRNNTDDQMQTKQDFMNTLAAIVEGDVEKATEILANHLEEDFAQTDVRTMTDAVKAWVGVGDEKRASQILNECEEKLKNIEDQNELTISTLVVQENEEVVGDKKSRALKFNKEGLSFYVDKAFEEAIDYFYQAYILFPKEHAFGLNLLQSMVEAETPAHKSIETLLLAEKLVSETLSDSNKARMHEIKQQLNDKSEKFQVLEATA